MMSGRADEVELRRVVKAARASSKALRRAAARAVRSSRSSISTSRRASYEALMGPSGSGKTTLLNLIAGLDRPTSGTIEVAGKRIDGDERGRARQVARAAPSASSSSRYNLLPVLTARRERRAPAPAHAAPARPSARSAPQTALRVVGLEDRMQHYPRQLSGGQEQRVAIARAIVNDPTIIVADEPTGDLDRQSADDILALLEKLNTRARQDHRHGHARPGRGRAREDHPPPRQGEARVMTLVGPRGAERRCATSSAPCSPSLGVAVAIVAFLLLRTVVWAWTSGADCAAKDRARHAPQDDLRDDAAQALRRGRPRRAARQGGDVGQLVRREGPEARPRVLRDPRRRPGDATSRSTTRCSVPPDQTARRGSTTSRAPSSATSSPRRWAGRSATRSSSRAASTRGDWQFNIDGIYDAAARSVDRSTFLFHWDYLERLAARQRRRDQVGWIVSRVDDPARVADIGVALDKMFDERDTPTLSQDERSFNASFLAMFSAILKAMDIISVVILVIMMLILGNTIAMGVRERTSEYGVLRAHRVSRRGTSRYASSASRWSIGARSAACSGSCSPGRSSTSASGAGSRRTWAASSPTSASTANMALRPRRSASLLGRGGRRSSRPGGRRSSKSSTPLRRVA